MQQLERRECEAGFKQKRDVSPPIKPPHTSLIVDSEEKQTTEYNSLVPLGGREDDLPPR